MRLVSALLLACAVLLLLHPHKTWARQRMELADDTEDFSPASAAPEVSSEEADDDESDDGVELQEAPEAEEPEKPKADLVIQARDLYEVDGDEKGAIRLFEEAAAAGNDDAMVFLGRIYEARFDISCVYTCSGFDAHALL